MNLVLNVIIIILESLYYSFFIKFSKNEGKIWKYFFSFLIISLVGVLIGVTSLISYLFLIIMMILSLKYIVKVKTSIYDILFIFIMMIFKIFIEGVSSIFISKLTNNAYIMATLLGIIKMIVLPFLKNTLNMLYNKLRNYWDNNVFYIRYIFDILMLIYVIASCGFLIFN